MNIILQNYTDLIKKLIFDTFSSNLEKELDKFESNNVMNYIKLLGGLDETLASIARKSLIVILESIDNSYSISNERKRKYDIKSYHTRTILTIFGEITYRRRFYICKLNRKLYCHVDRLLGLHKYDYFDPYIKALVIENSADNSYPKVAKIIDNLIGNRISIQEKQKYLSRQTVRNIIMRSTLSNPKYQTKKDVDFIEIIADEKFIHTQNNDKKDVMMKSVVVFEGVISKNGRKELKNKMIFASLDQTYLHDSIDYIYKNYDVEKFKNVFVMGDGAKWIKAINNYYHFHSKMNVIHGLDKFHYKQALHHIISEDDVKQALSEYILSNNKTDFNRMINEIIDLYPDRKETIEIKQKYILNNWRNILNMYKHNLSCPMESQISHNLAALFTSRPKGYSLKTIETLIKIRLLYKNKFNLKELYLNNFNSNIILELKKDELNFDLYGGKKNIKPYYKDKIYNSSYQYFFRSF